MDMRPHIVARCLVTELPITLTLVVASWQQARAMMARVKYSGVIWARRELPGHKIRDRTAFPLGYFAPVSSGNIADQVGAVLGAVFLRLLLLLIP